MLTSYLGNYGPVSYGSDTIIASAYSNNTVMTYLDNNLNVNLAITSAGAPQYVANSTDGYLCTDQVNSTVNVPSSLFGATACSWNSSTHCIYYEYDATTLAQASYDLIAQQWADTIFISL